ncbi:MAG: hypothetical protein HDS69_01310 [Bacteroidales bacterium]|nr:hypothetical protein [Bacteroidales bacterium]
MKLHKLIFASVMALAAGMGITSCDNDFDYPPVISPELGGNGQWDAPLSVPGATSYYNAYYSDAPDDSKYYWVTGFIVGCVNTTETVFVCNDQTAAFSAPFESTSNLLLAPTPDCTDYTQCISLQLPSGSVRDGLNLNANPSNLGRQVTVRGYIDKYLGIPGMRSLSHYQWGPEGIDTGEVEVGKSDFTLLTGDITSGRAYALVVDNSAAQTVTAAGDNGFLYTSAITISGNKFNASEQYGFMFTETEAGSGKYYITDYKGQFLYQSTYGTGWSNRPSVSKNPVKDDNSYLWLPVKNGEGRWVISNVASGSILAYDTNYKSYGIYTSLSEQYIAPELYEMANDPAIDPDFNPGTPGQGGDVSEGTGDGTLESPYDAVRALAIINAGVMSKDKVYIKGKVSKIDEIDTGSYGNATYYISNDGTANGQLQVFRGYYLNGDKFTASDAIKVGDEVVILGQLIMYNTTPEVAQGSSIISINGEGGSTVTPPVTGDGEGTQENPYNTASVIALNPTSTTEAPAGGSGVWVKGYIVGYMPSSGSTALSNTVFGAPADGKTNLVLGPTADCTDYTQCISVQLPNNDVRTALNLQENPGNLGAEVLLFGDVMKYCGGPGLKNTTKYVLNGQGTTDPGTPSTGSEIYSGLVSGLDGWTIDNVTMPAEATYIWDWKVYNGSGYLNGSAYINAAYASEAYAYTTVDLTGKTDATLTFDHAAKFQTTLRELCGLVVRVEGTSSWTALTIPTWPDAGVWTFVSSGDISLKAYAGKKIEIGFKYGSSTAGADTWEIKNFTIKGN